MTKKETKKYTVVGLKLATIAVLVAGVYVFGLPRITVEEAIGSVALVTLFAVSFKWVK